jgi:chromosome segregation ATPase
MAQRDRVDLQAALRGSVVPLSVKALKKKGVRRVKVIERERLLKALVQAVEQKLADRPASGGLGDGSPNEKKRVELLLVELERVSKAKTQLEHEKGLLEAERSRLAAELDRIAQEISKGTGHKVKPEEVKNLLEELERVREDRDRARKSLDAALRDGEHRLETESARAACAEGELAAEKARASALEGERDGLALEREDLAARAARLEEAEAEVARLSQERERLVEKNLQLQRDAQRFEAQNENLLQKLAEAAPILAAHRETEEKKAASEQPAPAETDRAPETPPSEAGRGQVKPPTNRRAIPGFGFGAPAREAPSRGGFSTFRARPE